MILDFLTVRTVADLLAIQLVKCHCRSYAEWDSLICRSEKHIKIIPIMLMDRLRIILSQLTKLCACHISSRIHKKWRFTTTLQCKVTKLQHITLHHKLDKFLLILFHCKYLLIHLKDTISPAKILTGTVLFSLPVDSRSPALRRPAPRSLHCP